VIIPHTELEPYTLQNLIESFVLREGTDYGEVEKTLEEKVDDIYKQLHAGDIVIQYSEETESINLVPANFLQTPKPNRP